MGGEKQNTETINKKGKKEKEGATEKNRFPTEKKILGDFAGETARVRKQAKSEKKTKEKREKKKRSKKTEGGLKGGGGMDKDGVP